MKAKLCVLLFLSLTIATHSFAKDNANFFDNKESSRYNTDNLPYRPQHDNRFDEEPIISVTSFDLSELIDQPKYNIYNKDLILISEKNIKENNGRYTIDRLNRLSQQLTRYYRQKGLLLARTYIAEQEIENGVIKVSIVEGVIEEITTVPVETMNPASVIYKKEVLARPFQALIGSPSYRPQLITAITQLTQYPGIKTVTHFEPGSSSGTTKLNIQIKEQHRAEGWLGLDNYGSKYTGTYRIHAGGNINNPTGNADKLTLGLMATISPSNSYYGNIFYTLPINPYFDEDGFWSWLNPVFDKGLTFDTGIQQSTYSIGEDLEALEIKGEATTLFYSLEKPFIVNSTSKLSSKIRLDIKNATSEQNGEELAEDLLSIANLSLNYRFADYLFDRANNMISIDIHQGLDSTLGSLSNGEANGRRGPNTGFAPPNFTKYNLSYSRLQSIDSYQFLSRFHYQHTDNILLPVEQVTLGGAYGVRGYTTSDYTADKAFQTTLEFIGKSYAEKLSLPIDNLSAALFLDYAIGWRNDTFANEDASNHLMAAGWYAEFVKEDTFQSRMQMAFPLSSEEPSNNNSIQFYLSMQRRF